MSIVILHLGGEHPLVTAIFKVQYYGQLAVSIHWGMASATISEEFRKQTAKSDSFRGRRGRMAIFSQPSLEVLQVHGGTEF